MEFSILCLSLRELRKKFSSFSPASHSPPLLPLQQMENVKQKIYDMCQMLNFIHNEIFHVMICDVASQTRKELEGGKNVFSYTRRRIWFYVKKGRKQRYLCCTRQPDATPTVDRSNVCQVVLLFRLYTQNGSKSSFIFHFVANWNCKYQSHSIVSKSLNLWIRKRHEWASEDNWDGTRWWYHSNFS